MKIVLLTWHFPPSSEIAGKVTFRLARQLVARGHEVTVVAPSLDKIRSRDPSFAERLNDGVRVIRVAPWSDVLAVMANFRKRVRKAAKSPVTAPIAPEIPAGRAPASGVHKFLRDLRHFPDSANRWIVPAARAVRRAVASEKADVILSVSPYFSTHLAAQRAYRKTSGIQWWAWSHDPASGNTFDLHPDNWRHKHLERWEANVVRECDGIAVTTEELADEFLRRFGRRPLVAGCGFDPLEIPERSAPPAGGPMILTHAGTLYGHRTPVPLLEALGMLKADAKITSDDIRLRLIGDSADLDGEPLEAAVTRLNLGDIVTVEPPVSQAEATGAILASHVGVVLAEMQPMQVPAKTFDYAGLHRPVFALADGATATFIERYGLGVVATRDTIAVRLMQLLEQYRSDHLAAMTARVVAGAEELTVARQFESLITTMEAASTRN